MFNSVPLDIFIIRSGLVRLYKLSSLAFWRICGQKCIIMLIIINIIYDYIIIYYVI